MNIFNFLKNRKRKSSSSIEIYKKGTTSLILRDFLSSLKKIRKEDEYALEIDDSDEMEEITEDVESFMHKLIESLHEDD